MRSCKWRPVASPGALARPRAVRGCQRIAHHTRVWADQHLLVAFSHIIPSRILRGYYATHATTNNLYLQLVLQGRYRGTYARPNAGLLPNMRRRGETLGGREPRPTLPPAPGRTGHHTLVAETATWTATQAVARLDVAYPVTRGRVERGNSLE